MVESVVLKMEGDKNAGDMNPRIYMVIVPSPMGFLAKPLIIPKKLYVHIMESTKKVNDLLEHADSSETLPPDILSKISEIFGEQIAGMETINEGLKEEENAFSSVEIDRPQSTKRTDIDPMYR